MAFQENPKAYLQRFRQFCHGWFDETLDTWMGVCRGSGVLINKNGKWLIKQYVLSLTVPNEKMKEVIFVLSNENLK